MKVFWKDSEMTTMEIDLMVSLRIAHYTAAMRDCASTVAVKIAKECGVPFPQAVAGALATLGHKHGPIEKIYGWILDGAEEYAYTGRRTVERHIIPGWGNSFYKDEPDPLFEPVREKMLAVQPGLVELADKVTARLHQEEKMIYPNPGFWTAATAIALGVRQEICSYLFLAPRMDAWAAIYNES